MTNDLHMMNGLYLYTNLPLYGHETPAPYVAETINRAHRFANTNGKGKGITELSGHKIIDSSILNDFPPTGTTGNFHAKTVEQMSKAFFVNNSEAIRLTSTEVIYWAKSINIDVLSKGRQT